MILWREPHTQLCNYLHSFQEIAQPTKQHQNTDNLTFKFKSGVFGIEFSIG